MAKCSRCGAFASPFSQSCPKCGVQFSNRISLKGLLILLIILICLSIPALIVFKARRDKARPLRSIQKIQTPQVIDKENQH